MSRKCFGPRAFRERHSRQPDPRLAGRSGAVAKLSISATGANLQMHMRALRRSSSSSESEHFLHPKEAISSGSLHSAAVAPMKLPDRNLSAGNGE